MGKYTDDSMAINEGFSRIKTVWGTGVSWLDGEVITEQGMVSIYAQGDDNCFAHTRLDFVFEGRLHMRNYPNKRYTKRGIAMLAKRFAHEITEGL